MNSLIQPKKNGNHAASSSIPLKCRPAMRPVGLAVRASLFGLSLALGSAHAADIIVDSPLDDDGAGCTLREAIASANSSVNQNNGCATGSDAETDRILFDPNVFSNGHTIALTVGELNPVNKNIQLDAASVGGLVINASESARVMRVTRGNVSLTGITLTGGRESLEERGGGLLLDNRSTVRLTNSHVTNNTTIGSGGGIHVGRNSSLTLLNSTVTRNFVEDVSSVKGGGISITDRCTLEIIDSEISYNTVFSRGGSGSIAAGLYAVNDNTITIANSSISNNYGSGISVINQNTLSLIDSRVKNNRLSTPGGGIDGAAGLAASVGSTVTILRSSISGNVGRVNSGGLGLNGLSANIVDSVISGNSNRRSGGGFEIRSSNVDFKNSTVSGNRVIYNGTNSFAAAGSISNSVVSFSNTTVSDNVLDSNEGAVLPRFPGLQIGSSSVTFTNSIVANSQNLARPEENVECYSGELSTITIDSATIIEGGGCDAVRIQDPGLLPLADNGGATKTHALAANSIAVNTGDTSTCLGTDQRGAVRDAQCDVGAFEFGVTVASISLSVLPGSVPENGGTSTGTISRTQPFDEPLMIALRSSDVTSVTVPSSVLIPAGEPSAEFTINAVDDLIADGDTATTITASANNFVDSLASITVLDNEVAALGLSLQTNTVAENGGKLTATLSRNTPITDALTVALTVGLGSNDISRVSVPANVTIPAGEGSTTVTVTVLDNQIADGDSANTITASADGLLSSSADLNITDNDVAMLTVSVSADSVAEEGGLLAGTVTRNTPSTDALAVTLTSSDVSSITVPAVIDIAAGQTMATFDISVVDNLIADGDRISTISASANGLANGAADVTVLDNEVAALNLNLSADNVAEDSGTLTATLSRNTPSQNALSVALSSSDSSKVTVPANVSIPIGQTSISFNVTVVDDSLVDGDSINTITANAVGLVDSSADVTVIDNDVPTLSLSVPSNSVVENSGSLLATLRRNTSIAEPLTVALRSNNINSLSVPASAMFAAGERSTTFDISVIDDSIAAGDSLTTISASVNGFVNGDTDIAVIDNEVPSLTLTFAQNTLVEGDSVLGRLTRNTPTTDGLTVTLTSSAPAVASVAQTVQIPEGEMFTEFEVASVDNQVIDPERTITIVASDAGGVINNASADLAVLDNDDNDGDNIANNVDNCPANSNTNQANLDGDQFGDACDNDIDGDGMPNSFEQANGLNPRNAADANADNDGDGFSNLQEFQFGSDPNVADVDENNNGIPDATEVSEFNVAPILFLILSDDEQ